MVAQPKPSPDITVTITTVMRKIKMCVTTIQSQGIMGPMIILSSPSFDKFAKSYWFVSFEFSKNRLFAYTLKRFLLVSL